MRSFVLLVIYAIGILLAVVMARLFCRFLVKGDDTPFVMELPPYRMPTSKAIFRHTWEKGAQYLRKMGGIIMVASIVIWALGYYPNHDEYESVTEQQENSYIGRIGKAMEPVIEPLGFDWKLGIGILSGLVIPKLMNVRGNQVCAALTASAPMLTRWPWHAAVASPHAGMGVRRWLRAGRFAGRGARIDRVARP